MKRYAPLLALILFSIGCGHTVIDLQTATFSIGIDRGGRIDSLVDRENGVDYLAPGEDAPLVSIVVDGVALLPSRLETGDGVMTLVFQDDSNRVSLRFEEKPSHIVLEVVEIATGGHLDLLIWGPYPTTISQSIGECVGVVRNDVFALGLQALNLKTLGGYPVNEDDSMPSFNIFEGDDYSDIGEESEAAELYRGNTASLTDFGSTIQAYCRNRDRDRIIPNLNHERYLARAFDDGGPIGSSIALFGCPSTRALDTIGMIELEEGLPHPEIDGEWGKTFPGSTASYLIVDFGEASLDHALDLTEEAGLSYLYHGSPFLNWGHFDLKKELFPDNWDSLKRCVERAETRGIRLGVHTLSNFITTNDPYVTPVPDPGLGNVGSSFLASDIDSTSREIKIEDPGFFNQFENNNLMTARIGEELVRYSGVTESEPWILTGCERGAFGTRASGHPEGEEISKLADHGYKTFLAGGDMQKEMAERIAELFNYTGLRQISFDGLEGCKSSGMGQYARTLFVNHWYQALNQDLRGRVINDASNPGHYFWHIYTRMNWGEPWYAGFRESQTKYRLKNQNFYARNLMPHMLGWFRMDEKTTLEDAEWLLARAAGFDAGFALVTSPEMVRRNGFGREILASIRRWEEARFSGVFSQELKNAMKEVENEFHLEEDGDGAWRVFRVSSGKFTHGKRERQPGEPGFSAFKYSFDGPRQPVSFIITSDGGTIDGFSLEIDNSRTIRIPARLRDGESLKYNGGNEIVRYNAEWQKTGAFPVEEDMLEIEPGSHAFNFDCTFREGNPEVKLELRAMSEPETLQVEKETGN